MNDKIRLFLLGAVCILLTVEPAVFAGYETEPQDDAQTSQTLIVDIEKSELIEKLEIEQNAGTEWFEEAGFGLFLHWDIITAAEGAYEISWSMVEGLLHPSNVMTPSEYFALAKKFNPKKYNPDTWLAAARRAGMTYAVLTVRHHDGYALWPSQYGNFSTKQYMNGRDLVKEFVDACRKNGLRVGLYYSPPDWYYNREYMSFRLGTEGFDLWAKVNPDAKPLGLDHEEIELKKMSAEWIEDYKAYMKGQVTELLTNYGQVDLLWFDYNFGGYIGMTLEEIRKLSPGTVVSHRWHGKGDFLTYEGALPKEKPPQFPWEMCKPLGASWAFQKQSETNFTPTAGILETLVTVRSMGGNYLANIGPRSDGTLAEIAYKRLSEVAQWMEYGRESVFNVKGAYWDNLCNYPVTTSKDNTIWYVHFLGSDNKPAALIHETPPASVVLLRTGQPLEWKKTQEGIRIELPENLKTDLVDTVKICW